MGKTKKKLLKAGGMLTIATGTGQACNFIRNIIVARLVTPADFGVAATFAMAVSFLEMLSDLSPDRLLIQAKDGDEPHFQKTAQLIQVGRGLVGCLFFLICGGWLASLFSVPGAADSFRILAIIPLMNGFVHLDFQRVKRHFNFWHFALVELTALVIMLVFSWPVAHYFGDYRAMLVLLILKSFCFLIGSHVCATRKYRLIFDKKLIKRFYDFGWPLLINGLFMFVIVQGDRFILASAKNLFSSSYDMADVGAFSVALSLTMIPATTLTQILGTFFLPILSHPEKIGVLFEKALNVLNDVMVLAASGLSCFLILLGDDLLLALYGEKYQSAAYLVKWMTIMWSMRCIRSLQISIAMSKGKTKIPMYSNILRFFAIVGSLAVVYFAYPLVYIVYAGIFAEAITNFFIVFLNYKTINIGLSYFFRGMLSYIIVVMLALFLDRLVPYQNIINSLFAEMAICVFLSAILFFMNRKKLFFLIKKN